MEKINDIILYFSQPSNTRRLLFLFVGVVLAFLALTVLLVALLCARGEKHDLLKEENSQLKEEMKQMKQNYSSGSEIKTAKLKAEMGTTQSSTGMETTTTAGKLLDKGCPGSFTDLGTGCYNVSEERMTFGQAVAYCASFDSHLSYITSATEQEAIESFMKDNSVDYRTWIGGYDRFKDDTFFWLDGSAVSNGYTSWAAGEPDGGDHDYVYLLNTEGWKWADQSADNRHYALCEIDI